MVLYCVRVLKPMFRVDSNVFLILAAISVILAIFAMIPLFSASNKADDIVNVSWAYTDKGVGDGWYIGVYKFAVTDGDDADAFSWDSASCDYVQDLYGDHFCNECENGQNFVIGFTAVFFVFSVFSAIAAVLRFKRIPGLLSDIVLQHAIVACGVVSFIFGVTAVAVFNTTCRRYWPFSGHDYEMGAAAVLIIFVIVAKVFEVVIHWLITEEALDHESTLQDVGPS